MPENPLVDQARPSLAAYLEQSTTTVVAILDDERRIVDTNRGWNLLFRLPETPVGQRLSDYVDGLDWDGVAGADDDGPLQQRLTLSVAEQTPVVMVAWLGRRQGGYALVGELRDQEADEVVARMSDIHGEMADIARELSKRNAELEKAKERIEELARTDDLTGLLNRRHFGQELERAVSFARRHDQPLALVLGDIDRFKSVNDEHGHRAGDQVLEAVASLVEESCRKEDLAARYGGEELVLALPSTGLEQACRFAERVRERIGEENGERGPVPVTISFGVTVLGPDDDLESLVHRADEALYRAKDNGRNRVESSAAGTATD